MTEINHGFILEEIIPNDHYILGGYGNIGAEIINSSRDWRNCIPAFHEVQNLNGIEPYACTVFGTLNAVETLKKYIYGVETDYSDRWLAKVAGISVQNRGGSPHTVAETLRNKGVVLEKDWSFDSLIKTVQEFYTDFPAKLYTLALEFIAEFDFGHDWVACTPKDLYDALQLSPLGFSVYAWLKDENGYYYKPPNVFDTHWVCLVYAEWGKYWLVLDSYMDNGELLKKVRWDALPAQAKRYKLKRQVVNENAWSWFIKLINKIVYGMA